MRLPRTTVIVPTYNEADNIRRLIDSILSQSPDLSVLVVDDNSPDGTGEIVRRIVRDEGRVELLRRERKMGLGSAYREGFARVLSQEGISYVMAMDADFSHDPVRIPVLIKTARQRRADLVIGSRYTPGGRVRGWDWKRLLLSSTANKLCTLLLGNQVKDYTAGFRCYRTGALKLINLASVRAEGYAFQVEMAARVLRKGLKVVEVPIEFAERRAGASKFGGGILAEAVFVLVLLFLKRLIT